MLGLTVEGVQEPHVKSSSHARIIGFSTYINALIQRAINVFLHSITLETVHGLVGSSMQGMSGDFADYAHSLQLLFIENHAKPVRAGPPLQPKKEKKTTLLNAM